MGKKSKRRGGKPSKQKVTTKAAPIATAPTPQTVEPIPTPPLVIEPYQTLRKLSPQAWDYAVVTLNPFDRLDIPYICLDAEVFMDKRIGSTEMIVHCSDCVVCYQPAEWTCSRCKSFSYCGEDHQKEHWKEMHKKFCSPNPRPHSFEINRSVFRGLSADCFEGHEYLMIRPTGKLGKLQDICDQVLEPFDHLVDAGLGKNPDDTGSERKILASESHPIHEQLSQRFGWDSQHLYEICSAGPGNRLRFIVLHDKDISCPTRAPSYYGRAVFSPVTETIRGAFIIYKISVGVEYPSPSPVDDQVRLAYTVLNKKLDARIATILHPINKAEIAHMLSERCKALDQGKLTTNQWARAINRKEQRFEEAQNSTC